VAKLKLPDALTRRHLLEGGVDPAKALAIAEAYLEAERELEAIAFLRAAEPASNDRARSLLEGLRDGAAERGDVFLMRIVTGALGDEPSSETWKAVARAATEAGRLQDAETAERLATVGD
jgi:hypothetical protein